MSSLPFPGSTFAAMNAITPGLPGFVKPNPMAFIGPKKPLGADEAGYYSTAPLERTLTDLVDPDLLAANTPRLTVGCANVSSGEVRYFDSKTDALPPAFPAVGIDGELYRDGGMLSNTPVEAVFEGSLHRSSIVFAVRLWRRQGEKPQSIWDVANREKDRQYASRAVNQIMLQRQIHRMRHVISALADRLPADIVNTPEVREPTAHGGRTRMHVVRPLAPRLKNEDHTKDVDFSPRGIEARLAGRLDEHGQNAGRQALGRRA